MRKDEDSGAQSWDFSSQTTEDVAKAVVAAVATVRPRPSVVFSAKKQNSNNQFQKLRRQASKIWKVCPFPGDGKRPTYNPEVLTSQKRQWTKWQLQSLERKQEKEPTTLFENIVVVGLHPNTDIRSIEVSLSGKNPVEEGQGSERLKDDLRYQHRGVGQQNLEPQVLFSYPPHKRLPLKYKDLLSFCFPSGLEAHLVERTPSMSELNEILLGQEHLKRNDLSFVFRLKVAGNATLYGCCMVVDEFVQKTPGLMQLNTDMSIFHSTLSRFFVSAPRCYCILSRMPFFNLHFEVLKSIFAQERLERITETISGLSLTSESTGKEEQYECNCSSVQENHTGALYMSNGKVASEEKNEESSNTIENDGAYQDEKSVHESKKMVHKNGGNQVLHLKTEIEEPLNVCSEERQDPHEEIQICKLDKGSLNYGQDTSSNLGGDIRHHVRHGRHESSDSFYSMNAENQLDKQDTYSSGPADTSASDDILLWAKANNHHSLYIVCEYYQLPLPSRGSSLVFQPLEHLQPLTFLRSGDTELRVAGSSISLRSCRTSVEIAEACGTLMGEEEAQALSVWTVATICGILPLECVLAIFSAALLEKQIIIVCSNLGVLSAVVLSVIPLIRPFQWQSLLLPVLPNSMLEFLDAPVPYVIGLKNRTPEVRTKMPNVILVDVNKNQVKTPTLPQLPQRRELLSALGPHHAKLVAESYLAKKRPVHEYTNEQAQAAEGFLVVLRSYLESMCSNLRAHTITNVQSNDDKVSLLLKESFIDSFSSKDRPFMKLFVDTQMFSVHTDTVLSFYQNE